MSDAIHTYIGLLGTIDYFLKEEIPLREAGIDFRNWLQTDLRQYLSEVLDARLVSVDKDSWSDTEHLLTPNQKTLPECTFPQLPFPITFLAIEKGIPATPTPESKEIVFVRGILLNESGVAYVIYRDSNTQLFHSTAIKTPAQAKWRQGFEMLPHTISKMFQNMDLLRTSLNFNARRQLRKTPKAFQGRFQVPYFYTVRLKPRTLSLTTPDSSPVGAPTWNHRWDVRSHERVHVRRGEGVLSEKDRQLLTRRGYTVYEKGDCSLQDTERLLQRSLPLRQEGEWLALRTLKIAAHVKGPEDKPYIPAIRVLS